jgi:FlaA1/EpsC-like NDP-sugar epimerase
MQEGGEIFVPKIPSYRLSDLCRAIDEKCKIKVVGIRPGEKIHEELISSLESRNTLDLKKYYIILPNYNNQNKKLKTKNKNTLVQKDFQYSSDKNENFLSIKSLRKMIFNQK